MRCAYRQSTGDRAKTASKKFAFPTNPLKLESITLEDDLLNGQETVITRVDGVDQRLVCGRGNWQEGRVAWGTMPQQSAAIAGGWTNDKFTAKICFYETPFIVTVRLKFSGNDVTVNSESNVGFGSTKLPELVGKSQ